MGIPTTKRLGDEVHLPHLGMFVSGFGKNRYGVEWMRFEPDADYPDLVKSVPHVAFEVDCLSTALDGKNVIIQPNSPSPGVMVAFIEDNGVPIELMEIDRSIAEEGI